MSGVQNFFSNIDIPKNYLQAGIAIILAFLLILIVAQIRRYFVGSSIKAGFIGLFFGAALILIIEGFFILNGHTALTSVLGWNNAPKPISTALDLGKSKIQAIICIP